MACGGHCNQCAAHPGYVGPATPSVWTDDPVEDSIVKEVHWDELRDSIDAETTRRSETWSGAADPGNVSVGDSIHSAYDNLRDQLIYLGDDPSIADPALDNSYPVIGTHTDDMRTSTNTLEAVCICNCNYPCTCNCNYPCTCNCAHACLCNCAYSDERLKKEIEYL